LDIADADPGHHAMVRVNARKTQYHSPSRTEFFVAKFYQRDNRFVDRIFQKCSRCLGGIGRFFAVSYAVNRCNQNSAAAAANQVVIA
jgi:hypothetical protein